MRVLLLNQFYAPDEAATAQMLADLGEELARAGHEIEAICCDHAYGDPARKFPARETIGGVKILRVRSSGFGRGKLSGRLADYATFLVGAARRIFTRRFDAVVFLSTPPLIGLLGIAAARLRASPGPHGPPSPAPGEGSRASTPRHMVERGGASSARVRTRPRAIFWSMDVYPELAFEFGALRRRSIAGRVLLRLARVILNGSDQVVALGPTMAKRLERGSGGAANITFIHNWADGDAIRPRSVEGHPLRAQWGWDRRFVVLYSGNLGFAHEFETVLGAAALLRDAPEILFAFVGAGPMAARVRREAAERNLVNLEFRDSMPRSALGESLTAGDVHLVTLRDGLEGLLVPSKIYGILAAGRPTLYVGPGAGEVFEIVKNGSCGFAVENGDSRRLASQIAAYAGDLERRRREGENARALFEGEFSKDKALERWKRVIEG